METIQQVGAVTLVLALLLLTLWWLRKRGIAGPVQGSFLNRRPGARRLESVERLPLGPQQALYLVRLGGAALLISSSPSGCALLHRVEWREIEITGGAQ